MNRKEKDIKNQIRIYKYSLEYIKKIDIDRCMAIEAYDDNNNKLHIAIPQEYVREVEYNLRKLHEELLKIEEDKLKQLYSEQQ